MVEYEYRHLVSFEETNLVGNVYFANHVRWQGRCREMFIKDHAPGVLAELNDTLRMVTVRCSVEYLDELRAFDEVVVHMKLESVARNRIAMEFQYFRVRDDERELVARGSHEVATMRASAKGLVPTPIPAQLARVLGG